MANTIRPVVPAALLCIFAGSGCWLGTSSGSNNNQSDADIPVDAFIPEGGTIAIYLTGDVTPKTYADGLSGQTPTNFHIALSKYYLQTSLDDPSPVLCFDHGNAPVEAAMHRDNFVGYCVTANVPNAVYTHGRVKVEWLRYTVEGTVHHDGYVLPGHLTFFRAYSDTTYRGQPYAAGEGTVAFDGEVQSEIPVSFEQIQQWPDIRLELIEGEFWMTFPYSRPLPIDQTNTDRHWARFHWEIYEAFRWQDRNTPGFTDGVWDASTIVGASEDVNLTGASGYFVTASTD